MRLKQKQTSFRLYFRKLANRCTKNLAKVKPKQTVSHKKAPVKSKRLKAMIAAMFKKEKSLNSKMSDETLSVNLFVICDYALVSQEGKLSINGIFDNIYTEQTPSIHPQTFIVLSLKGKPLSEHRSEEHTSELQSQF